MVLFHEIEIENFKKYKDKKVYSFEEGLIGIFGKNESGKSTIGDAILVSLFGLTKTTFKKDDIITWGEKSSTLTLEFETDKLYKIIRTIGKTKSSASLSIYISGNWELIENNISNVDNRIIDILGLDFKSFKNSIFVGQNDLNALSSLSKNDRQQLINRLSRYEELSSVEKKLKMIIKEINNNLKFSIAECENLNKEVNAKIEKQKEINTLKKSKSIKENDLNINYEYLNAIEDEIKIYDQLIILKDLKEKTSNIDVRISETEDQLKNINNKENEKEFLKNQINNYSHINPSLKDNIRKIGTITEKFKTSDFNENIEKKQILISEKEKELNNIISKESERTKLVHELDQLKYVSKNLKMKINDVGDIILSLTKIQDQKNELYEINSSISELKTKISSIDEKEKEKELYLANCEKLSHINFELRNKIEDISLLSKKLSENQDNIQKSVKNEESFSDNIKNNEKLKNEKKSQLNENSLKEDKIIDMHEKLDKLNHVTPELKDEIDIISSLKSNLNSKKSYLQKIIKDKNDKKDKLKNMATIEKNKEKYDKYLTLTEENKEINQKIQTISNKISKKQEELEKFDFSSKDPNEIETEYGSKVTKSIILIIIGISLIAIGGILGFLTNIFFIVLSLISVVPVFKGFNDRNKYASYLKEIKSKREDFGSLKELINNLDEFEQQKQELKSQLGMFKNEDIGFLKKHAKVFNEISSEKYQLEDIRKSEKITKKELNDLTSKLHDHYYNLPETYQTLSVDNEGFVKEISNLFLKESNNKNNYESMIADLRDELSKNSHIKEEFDNFSKEIEMLKIELKKEKNKNEELASNNILIKNELKNQYNLLPQNYKGSCFDNPDIGSKLIAIYQKEDKERSNLKIQIENLDKIISEKENDINKLNNLESSKNKLELAIGEERGFEFKLNQLVDSLPSEYVEDENTIDNDFYNHVSDCYNKDDKRKSNINSRIEDLNKEIGRKEEIILGKNKLIDEKTLLEKRRIEFEEECHLSLKNLYNQLPPHYNEIPMNDPDISLKLNEIYQKEDKKMSGIKTRIDEIDKIITIKSELLEKLKGLNNEKNKIEGYVNTENNNLKNLTNNEDLEYDSSEHEKLKNNLKQKNNKIDYIKEEIHKIEGNIKPLLKDIVDLEEKIEKLQEINQDIKEKKFNQDVHEITMNEISATAKLLREQVMDRTTKHMANFLPKITNNRYSAVKVSDDFKVNIYSPEKNDFVSLDSLSGGTRDQVLFAFRLAFTNSILGGRSHTRGFALFLDEFLGSFDYNRRNKTLKMLKSVEDDFKQIMLISHIEGMDNDMDQVIKTPEI